MEHNMLNTSLHWGGYTTTTTQNHWGPPQTRSHKRALSESDCDDLYSEESSKEQTSPGEPGSCQLLSRKKRRGVIEKKRRDRINSSLSELKRLVPSAYEKQGSAKLEKAEILQLTVEHLKNLHVKEIDSLHYDPQRVAMDYHIIGFRECAAEVARYLVTIEGMDIQDPLRLRLMSHLQYFVQQREISAKAGVSPSWSPTSYQPNCTSATYQPYSVQANVNGSYVPNLPAPVPPYPTLNVSPITSTMQQQPSVIHSSRTSAPNVASTNDSVSLLSHSVPQQQQPSQQAQQPQAQSQSQSHDTQQNIQHQHYSPNETHEHQGATYIELTSNNQRESTTATSINYGNSSEYGVSGAHVYNPNEGGISYVVSNSSKPYRPWGAEMAY